MEKSSDRYEVFVKRLELSSDPGAAEYLRATNAQVGSRVLLPHGSTKPLPCRPGGPVTLSAAPATAPARCTPPT
eukprot:364215-Chlamydomonas_euryale.AAC.15